MRIGLQYFAGRCRSRVCWQITNNTLLLFRLQVVGNDDGGGDGNDEGTQQTTTSQTSSFD